MTSPAMFVDTNRFFFCPAVSLVTKEVISRSNMLRYNVYFPKPNKVFFGPKPHQTISEAMPQHKIRVKVEMASFNTSETSIANIYSGKWDASWALIWR